jgi:hypothetical protein
VVSDCRYRIARMTTTSQPTARCPLRGCAKPRGRRGDGACCGAHATAIRMRKRGLISLPAAAAKYKTDRRLLKRLYERNKIPGELDGDKVYLNVDALDAWMSSRPRCIVKGCKRPVLGEGPGCNLKAHQRVGQHWSADVKDKVSATRKANHPVNPKPTPPPCSEPDCDNPAPGRSGLCAEHHQQRLQEGHQDMRAAEREAIRRVKRERKLLDVKGVQKRLKRKGLTRSTSGILKHTRGEEPLLAAAEFELRDSDGELLESHGTLPELFTEAEVDSYAERLKHHPDGRMRRYDEDLHMRLDWYKNRHGGTAEHGRHAQELAAENGNGVGRKSKVSPEQEARIWELRAQNPKLGTRIIAERVTNQRLPGVDRVSREQVMRVLKTS